MSIESSLPRHTAILIAGRFMFTLIFLFLVPVTITVHGVGMISGPEEMQAAQLSVFLKGIAMAGGALLISQLGVQDPD